MQLLRPFDSVNAKRALGTQPAAAFDAAPNELTLALAEHLNAIKKARGLSQPGMAAITGLSQAYMARVLRDEANIGLGMLLVIAQKLDEDPLSHLTSIKQPKKLGRQS